MQGKWWKYDAGTLMRCRNDAPMFGYGATQDEVFMALAKYVPAISSATGHTNVMEDLMSHRVNERF